MILVALLSACDDRESAKRHASESACYSADLAGYRADRKIIDARYKEARAANRPTVDVVIERQRRIDRHCLEAARCYGSTGPALSNMFESCLEDERE